MRIGTWRSLAARYTGGVEVAGSNPVVPTFLQIRPFGEYVKRLSLLFDQTYVVQTNRVEDLPTDGIV